MPRIDYDKIHPYIQRSHFLYNTKTKIDVLNEFYV